MKMFLQLGLFFVFLVIILIHPVVAVCDEIPATGYIDYNVTLNPNCTYYVDSLRLDRGVVFDGQGATITTHNSTGPLFEGWPKVFKNVVFDGWENLNLLVLGFRGNNPEDAIEMYNIKVLTRGRIRPIGWVNICNISINHFNPEDAQLNMSPDCTYMINDNQIDLNTDYFCNGAMIEPLFLGSSSIMSMIEDPNVTINDCLFNNTWVAMSFSLMVYSHEYVMIRNNKFFNINFSEPVFDINTAAHYPVIDFETGAVLIDLPPKEWIDSWKSDVFIVNNTIISDRSKELLRIGPANGDDLSINMNIFVYNNVFVNGVVSHFNELNFSNAYFCVNGTGNVLLNATYNGTGTATCPGFSKEVDLSIGQKEAAFWSKIIAFFKRLF